MHAQSMLRLTLAGLVAILLLAAPNSETRAGAVEEAADWLNSIGLKYRRKPWTPETVRKAYSIDLTRSSATPTRAPCAAAIRAARVPPEPAPMTKKS